MVTAIAREETVRSA